MASSSSVNGSPANLLRVMTPALTMTRVEQTPRSTCLRTGISAIRRTGRSARVPCSSVCTRSGDGGSAYAAGRALPNQLRKHAMSPVAVVTGAGRGQGAAEAACCAHGGGMWSPPTSHGEVDVVADVCDASAWTALVEPSSSATAGSTAWSTTPPSITPGRSSTSAPTRSSGCSASTRSGPFSASRPWRPPCGNSGSGSIVNVSSYAGSRGLPGHTAYGAAKWALRGISRTAAVELGPLGIRVNTVLPGPIDTADVAGPGRGAADPLPPSAARPRRARHRRWPKSSASCFPTRRRTSPGRRSQSTAGWEPD